MAFSLRKATSADAEALADIYLSAFHKDAISILVFPRNVSSRKFWVDMILEELPDPNAHHICVYSTADPSQAPFAFAKWNTSAAEIPSEMPVWPEGADVEIANYFFGELFRQHKVIMEERRHWYLELVATRPEWQGKGAAAMLLRWGLQKADEEGIECFLEASPEGRAIYEHLGFREVDKLSISLQDKAHLFGEEKEFVEVFMVRSGTRT